MAKQIANPSKFYCSRAKREKTNQQNLSLLCDHFERENGRRKRWFDEVGGRWVGNHYIEIGPNFEGRDELRGQKTQRNNGLSGKCAKGGPKA